MKKILVFIVSMMLMATMVMAQGNNVVITDFPWLLGFESEETNCTFIDADGDGHNWEIKTSNYFSVHSGNCVAASASFDVEASQPLIPDNWMILPAIVIPSDAANFELTWYAKGQDGNWGAEHYSVYVSTTGNSLDDFVEPVFSTTTSGNWVEDWEADTVSLDDYLGDTVYIAFRHHDCTNMFYLNIDDIKVDGIIFPEVTVEGPAEVRLGEPAVFTAVCTAQADFVWTTNAATAVCDGNTATLTWGTAGTGTVSVEANNIVGSSIAETEIPVFDCTGAISEFPYFCGFENYLGCWRTYAAEYDQNEMGITDEVIYEGGTGFFFSCREDPNYHDQYLISPRISLPDTVRYMARFMYYATTEDGQFQILASTDTNDVNSFTNVLFSSNTMVEGDWVEMTCPLPDSIKYIAIKHYGPNTDRMYVDDFFIDTLVAPTLTFDGPSTIGTRQQAIYTAYCSMADSIVWTIDDSTFSTPSTTWVTLSQVFTTPGLHTVSAVAVNSKGTDSASVEVDVFDCHVDGLPFVADFSEGLHCWTNISYVSKGYGWFAAQDVMEEPEGQVVSMSAYMIGDSLVNVNVDNYLVSPFIPVPEGKDIEVRWKVKPYSVQYPADRYEVHLVTINQNWGEDVFSFAHTEVLNSNTEFSQRSVHIRLVGDYLDYQVGEDFRIAFEHWTYGAFGGYMIMLDDIEIVAVDPLPDPGAIDPAADVRVAVYPNPATDCINVEGEDIVEVCVLDLNGCTVATAAQAGAIDVSMLNAGMYIVRVVAAGGVHVGKIIKN